jgi:hypothetical protein
MQIYKVETDLVTTGGTGSVNTLDIVGGMARQIYILAAATDSTFQARILDNKSRKVREYDYIKGCINDETPLIMQGVYTVQILNCSSDQTFTVLFMVGE